ncbi:hypothetical protein NA56DRAFT_681304 [Hyaloscypha hepaticicola]|uniref:Uncharacterized protein n=1 Tax=Hyaloscypha hepaticicola TaxID=2082293 RepID=A0A2J6PT44_9HELO|nr:hypothetical protein NA56DRAFT_681304 [Hyaloscypha hepaticicola]
MVSNKNRLYIALFPSGVSNNEERRYHWEFLIGPKVEDKPRDPGMQYHVKNHPSTTNLLARIVNAKIEHEPLLINIFCNMMVVPNDPNWRCRTWIADDKIEQLARDYVAKKNEAGRYCKAEDMVSPKPTWNMLEAKEDVP